MSVIIIVAVAVIMHKKRRSWSRKIRYENEQRQMEEAPGIAPTMWFNENTEPQKYMFYDFEDPGRMMEPVDTEGPEPTSHSNPPFA